VAAAFPYIVSLGLIAKILDKITEARRPERFTQDFLETKLGFSGGSAMQMIPLLKRIGFLASDGVPTAAYDLFRNPDTRGESMAEGLRVGYKELFDANEYAHALTKEKLSALITQLTGAEKDSSATRATVATFHNLKQFADFDKKGTERAVVVQDAPPPVHQAALPSPTQSPANVDLKLSYTINLNLPESTNPEVFNAIFKSLKEHLLTEKS
jgi:Family of unknown function (DUF5343)